MFDLPDAKRVRRVDLYTSPSSSRSPSPSEPNPELENVLQRQLAALYGPISLSPASSKPHNLEPEEEEQEQEFEFRLFTTSKSQEGDAQKIILKEEKEDAEGGFVSKPRPISYFIRQKAEGKARQELESVAVSGDTIKDWSRRRAWGLEVPWRVTVLRVKTNTPLSNGALGDVVLGTLINEGQKGKKKPGKKRRIYLREKKRKRDKIEERRKKERELKEENEREKKTRRNREKKVKRKMKEKAEKEMARGAGVGAADGDTRKREAVCGVGVESVSAQS